MDAWFARRRIKQMQFVAFIIRIIRLLALLEPHHASQFYHVFSLLLMLPNNEKPTAEVYFKTVSFMWTGCMLVISALDATIGVYPVRVNPPVVNVSATIKI